MTTLEELARQNSTIIGLSAGLGPEFSTQGEYSSPNGEPNDGDNDADAVDVEPAHVTVVRVIPDDECDFQVWGRFEGEDEFDEIDGADRSIEANRALTVSTSAIAELYVEITDTTDDVTVRIGPCLKEGP